jgi:hypothetical protein
MKYSLPILLIALSFSALAQDSSIVTNSFKAHYQQTNPNLQYTYDSIAQTHHYANNWDFDNDGKNDQLSFVGKKGTHLYYYLKIKLSSDHKQKPFHFLQSDLPILTAIDTNKLHQLAFGFVIARLGKRQSPSIIIPLDQNSVHANKKILKAKKIRTSLVLISFRREKLRLSGL